MIRVILVAMTVILCLIFSVPLLTVLRPRARTDPVGVQKVSLGKIQGVFRFILKLTGVICEVQGLENIPSDRVVLYVDNHRSYFDILVDYMTALGLTGFVAKKEMLRISLLHIWMQRVNCLFLDRMDIREGLKTILEGIEKVKSGVSIWIFPEKTRNENQELTRLLPLHEGSLKIAQKSECPVIPVAITDTAEIFEQHLSFVKPSHVYIHYGELIYIKEFPVEKRKFPGAYTRDVIGGILKEMKEEQEQDK